MLRGLLFGHIVALGSGAGLVLYIGIMAWTGVLGAITDGVEEALDDMDPGRDERTVSTPGETIVGLLIMPLLLAVPCVEYMQSEGHHAAWGVLLAVTLSACFEGGLWGMAWLLLQVGLL